MMTAVSSLLTRTVIPVCRSISIISSAHSSSSSSLLWAALQISLSSFMLGRWWRSRGRQPSPDATRTRRGLYLALGWRFTKNANLQLGYLNHYVIKGDGAQKERNHTLQAGLTYNLDWRRGS